MAGRYPLSTKRNTLTIDRRLWARGGRNAKYSQLLVDGKMCCLGFHALACGLSKDDIEGMVTPRSAISEHKLKVPAGMKFLFNELFTHSPAAQILMDINDDIVLNDDERERQLVTVFAENGWDVTFTGPKLEIGEVEYPRAA